MTTGLAGFYRARRVHQQQGEQFPELPVPRPARRARRQAPHIGSTENALGEHGPRVEFGFRRIAGVRDAVRQGLGEPDPAMGLPRGAGGLGCRRSGGRREKRRRFASVSVWKSPRSAGYALSLTGLLASWVALLLKPAL